MLLYQVADALRQEQLTGTFEALLATPTSGATLQFGSVAYTLILVPIRAAILLTAIGAAVRARPGASAASARRWRC